MHSTYKKAKALYQAGLYKETVAALHPIKHLPFRDGQRIRLDTTEGTLIGTYVGTLKDSILISAGHPVTVPFEHIKEICVFWT